MAGTLSIPKSSYFLPYQTRWIKDGSRIKLMEKSRQIGMSFAGAYALVRRKAPRGARFDGWVSSRDDIQAKLFLEDSKRFSRILNIAAKDLGLSFLDEERKISAYVLAFQNGRRIHSMSSNPDAQAGKRGDRLLDEFALHPDPRKLYGIAYPGSTWGGQLEIISTHRGSFNFFNELIREIREKGNPKKISHHRVTLYDAIEQGFLERLQAKLPEEDDRKWLSREDYVSTVRAECPDEETFAQEFLCEPADDSTAFLSFDLIASCEYADGEPWKDEIVETTGPLYLGMDVGRDHDLTVLWIAERLGEVLYTRDLIELNQVHFDEQEAVLWTWLRDNRIKRACLDNTGIGRMLGDRAKRRWPAKVELVNFTAPVKEELAYPVRQAFESRTVRIPPNSHNRYIRSDLRSIKKETTASNNVRFTADRGKNGHADRFWSLALCLHAGKLSFNPGPIVPFKRERRSGRSGSRSRRMLG